MDEKDEREAKESRSNPKPRDESEGYFVQNLASGRHHGREGKRHSIGGRYLCRDLVLVRWKLQMDGGTVTRLILR